MSVILNIDTSIEKAYISIAKDGEILVQQTNEEQKEHGSFLQPAVRELLSKLSMQAGQLDAVSVSNGPGSYTGLRVSMASAKGLCFALNKPLITVGSLDVLAYAAILDLARESWESPPLFFPMIDARRMEVFTAGYDTLMNVVMEPVAMVLNEASFANTLLKNRAVFFGNGAEKWRSLCRHPHASYAEVKSNALAMSILAYKKYECEQFTELAYSQPFYLKEFFDHSRSK
jgi:tRNA threonylcarbamoyladenosine biosynthesis protein TsaB